MDKKLYYFLWGIIPVGISVICFAISFLIDRSGLVYTTSDMGIISTIFGTLEFMVMVIALPVGLLGWLLIWGDNGPPGLFQTYPYLELAAGFVLWFLLGIVACFIYRAIKKME